MEKLMNRSGFDLSSLKALLVGGLLFLLLGIVFLLLGIGV
jgi:hypothetical protein